MNKFLKILKADPERKTRLHDLRGNFIGWGALLALPLWFWHWSRAKCGIYARLPWIPGSVRRKFEAVLRPEWTVLECGSGMSSLWWASKVKRVVSLETNPAWHGRLKKTITEESIGNLELHMVKTYQALLQATLPEADLVVIDGDERDECAKLVCAALRRPIWVYLDNSDFAATQREMQEAEKAFLNLGPQILSKEYFRGVPPGQLAPTQGLLLRLTPKEGNEGNAQGH